MSVDQRKHTRFSLEIPAVVITKYGERQETVLQQISIGGCFTGWEENIFTGDEFRMEIRLPNGNKLPLACKAVYRFENTGIGVRFTDISRFEQSLVSKIIEEQMRAEGLPMLIDPFSEPSPPKDHAVSVVSAADERRSKDEILEKIMSGD